MKQGLVFDIERFSTADGPGIRTVVFFKGCNLHCYWCHNPESLKLLPEVEFTPGECLDCGACGKVCPRGCHVMTERGHEFLRENCAHCLACAKVCPVSALKVIGLPKTVEDCMKEIREDTAFYARSGGGVTLSGGEVLLQSEFAAELLKACRAEGIHTAIESNLSLDRSHLERVLPHLDLVMADIKHMDSAIHRQGTGLGNKRTLENLRWLDSQGIPLIIRTPVIPGFNDSEENIGNTAVFLSELENLCYYELLSYNPMGNDKRKRLGYAVPEIAVPDKRKMLSLARTAKSCRRPVWVDGRQCAE